MNTKESLQGKAIVITGVFEKYSRKELKGIIQEGGGKASSSISKNTSFILAGDKMGPNKKLLAEELNIEMIGEEEFLKKYI
jgi:DNA ligase (NAD+)